MRPSIPPGPSMEPAAVPPSSSKRSPTGTHHPHSQTAPGVDAYSQPLPSRTRKSRRPGFARWALPPPPPPGLERGRPCPAGCRVSAIAPSASARSSLVCSLGPADPIGETLSSGFGAWRSATYRGWVTSSTPSDPARLLPPSRIGWKASPIRLARGSGRYVPAKKSRRVEAACSTWDSVIWGKQGRPIIWEAVRSATGNEPSPSPIHS